MAFKVNHGFCNFRCQCIPSNNFETTIVQSCLLKQRHPTGWFFEFIVWARTGGKKLLQYFGSGSSGKIKSPTISYDVVRVKKYFGRLSLELYLVDASRHICFDITRNFYIIPTFLAGI